MKLLTLKLRLEVEGAHHVDYKANKEIEVGIEELLKIIAKEYVPKKIIPTSVGVSRLTFKSEVSVRLKK